MDLLNLQQIGIPGPPVAGDITLGQNAIFQEFIPNSFDTGHPDALSYLPGNFLPVELGLVQWIYRAHVNPLAAVAFHRSVGKVVSYSNQPLLMSIETAFSDFNTAEGTGHVPAP